MSDVVENSPGALVDRDSYGHRFYSDPVHQVVERRRLLKTLAAAGAAAGFWVVGGKPYASAAMAACEPQAQMSRRAATTLLEADCIGGSGGGTTSSPSFTEHINPNDPKAGFCGPWNPDDTVSCANAACVGASAWEMGYWFATTCAEAQNTNNDFQWLFEGNRAMGGGTTLSIADWGSVGTGPCDISPSGAGSGGSARDAWRWKTNVTCGNCATTTWRCHDGVVQNVTVVNGDTYHGLVIAQGMVYCESTYYSYQHACP